MKIKVIIASNDLNTMQQLKEDVDFGKYKMRVVDVASAQNDMYDSVKKNHPKILFADQSMIDGNGLEILARIRKNYSDCRIVMLGSEDDFQFLYEAFRLGIKKYIK